MKVIDLPDFQRNTEAARKKMLAKASEKGNTWRYPPFYHLLYNELRDHVEKLRHQAFLGDRERVRDAALDCMNYCNMIIDNTYDLERIDLSDQTVGTPGANR